VDFTITDPQPEKSGNGAHSDPVSNASGTAAAATAEAHKVSIFSSLFNPPPGSTGTFTAFGADTLGALGPSATTLLNKLASRAFPTPAVVEADGVSLPSNPPRARFLRQARAYLGIAIARGSADVIRRWALYCVPPHLTTPQYRWFLRTPSERLAAGERVA
jgi:hypothetical protein